jgi:hypothetical protein
LAPERRPRKSTSGAFWEVGLHGPLPALDLAGEDRGQRVEEGSSEPKNGEKRERLHANAYTTSATSATAISSATTAPVDRPT